MQKLSNILAQRAVVALLRVLENPEENPALFKWAVRFVLRGHLDDDEVGDFWCTFVESCYEGGAPSPSLLVDADESDEELIDKALDGASPWVVRPGGAQGGTHGS